jgi:hypothetical protein
MSYDVLALCKEVNGNYGVEPGVMYPATIARIQEVLAGDAPAELLEPDSKAIPWLDPVVKRFYDEALAVADWNSAEALSLARSWFQRALALKVGPPVKVHYFKDENYRR